jgi:hypothetical protein
LYPEAGRFGPWREYYFYSYNNLRISTACKNHIKRFLDVESIIDHFLMMSDAGADKKTALASGSTLRPTRRNKNNGDLEFDKFWLSALLYGVNNKIDIKFRY